MKIERHLPDFNTLASEVEERAKAKIARGEYRCIFLNPIATVLADEPTPAFFRAVRQHQRRWFKQAGHVFPRSIRRSVRDYIADDGRMSKRDRYLHRARCWTGILYRDGWMIQTNRWDELEASTPEKLSRNKITSFREIIPKKSSWNVPAACGDSIYSPCLQ